MNNGSIRNSLSAEKAIVSSHGATQARLGASAGQAQSGCSEIVSAVQSLAAQVGAASIPVIPSTRPVVRSLPRLPGAFAIREGRVESRSPDQQLKVRFRAQSLVSSQTNSSQQLGALRARASMNISSANRAANTVQQNIQMAQIVQISPIGRREISDELPAAQQVDSQSSAFVVEQTSEDSGSAPDLAESARGTAGRESVEAPPSLAAEAEWIAVAQEVQVESTYNRTEGSRGSKLSWLKGLIKPLNGWLQSLRQVGMAVLRSLGFVR